MRFQRALLAKAENSLRRLATSNRGTSTTGSANAATVRDEFTRQSGWFEADWSARSSMSNDEIMEFVLDACKTALDCSGGARGGSKRSAIDVCTGTGVFARALARYGGFESIVGVDITPAMLEEARQNSSQELDLCNLEFMLGDAVTLPFSDDFFDVAVTRLAIHHLPEPYLAIKEMARVVKPGGHVVIVDIVVGGNDLTFDGNGGADPCIAKETNRLERLRDPSHTVMLSRAEICSLLERCGLTPSFSAPDTPLLTNAMDLKAWMDATKTKPHAVQQIERSLEIEMKEDGTKTGMGPFMGKDERIFFTHNYAVFQAAKSFSSPAGNGSSTSNVTLDWGLAEDGNRSNIISAGAGRSNLHTNSPSVTQPEMPELAWRALATGQGNSATRTSESDPEILRKKLRWAATKRGWAECGDFLNAWVDAGGLSRLPSDALPSLERLLQCDDMFLMSIILGTKATPHELDTAALTALKDFIADHGWEG